MTKSRLLVALLLSTLAPLSIGVAKEGDSFARAREAFKRAYEQVDATTHDPQPPDSEALRTYPLYPYLQAARIRRALADVSAARAPVDERAQTFTSYYEHDPAGRALRRVWLASLAERREWRTFLDEYRDDVADDSLQCLKFTAQIELDQTADLAADIAQQWLTPRSLPDCERAFDWLRAQNALTPPLIEQRARRALDDNNPAFARQIAGALPRDQAAPLLLWAALLEQPRREIDALIASPGKAVEPDALLAGWSRLTRTAPDATILRLDALVRARGMTKQTASPYALALALSLAWNRRPETLEYFARVEAGDLDDYALEWQTRAALWAEDWRLAATSIAAMSDGQRTQGRWRYWTARAAERTDDPALARQLI